MKNITKFLTVILSLSLITIAGCKKKSPVNDEPQTPPAPIEFTIDNYVYHVNSDSVSVTLTKCIELQYLSGDVNIPETVSYDGKEYTVTAIGDYAFNFDMAWTEIGTLTLPNTITKIGDWAFHACGFTGNLNLPSSLTYIGECAFSANYHFSGSLYIPDSVTFLGDNAFNGCYSFEGTLHIPSNITAINDGVFEYCCNLTGPLNIPETVTKIGNRAFESCYGFTGNLEFPESVTYIGEFAFYDCTQFIEVISRATEPPTLRDYVFPDDRYTTLTVPCNSGYQYEHSPWILYFETIEEDCDTARHFDRSEAEWRNL